MQPERKWGHVIVLMWQKTTPTVLIDNDNSCLCVGHEYLNILFGGGGKQSLLLLWEDKKVFQFLLHDLSFILTKDFICRRTRHFPA